eukprot:scaffold72895_cov30-Tisochrysis_lutea.AAC.2
MRRAMRRGHSCDCGLLVDERGRANFHLLAEQPHRRGLDETLREASLLILLTHRARLNVLVGKNHRTHLELAVIKIAAEGEEVEDMITKTADGPLLARDEHLVLGGELHDELRVKRLHPPRVGNSDANLLINRLDVARRLHRLRQASTEREDGHLALGVFTRLAHDAALA